MDDADIQKVLASPLAKRLLDGDELARLAYIATDGTPRVIPMGFFFDGHHVIACTATNAAKVKALKVNDKVALTIDTTVHPPNILLIRGTASLETVDGVFVGRFGITRLEDRCQPSMKFRPSRRELRPVGNRANQRMAEGVFRAGSERHLVDQLRL